MEAYRKTREIVLLERDISPGYELPSLPEYSRYALKNGSMQEKREIVKALSLPLGIHDQDICQISSGTENVEEFTDLELNTSLQW